MGIGDWILSDRVVAGCKASSPEISASWLLMIDDWLLLSWFGLRRAIKLPAGCSILERLMLEEKVVMEFKPYLVDSEIDWPISMAPPDNLEIRDLGSEGLRKEKDCLRGERRDDRKEGALSSTEEGVGGGVALRAKGLRTVSPATWPWVAVVAMLFLSFWSEAERSDRIPETEDWMLSAVRLRAPSSMTASLSVIGERLNEGSLNSGQAISGRLIAGIEISGRAKRGRGKDGKESLGSWMSGRLMSKAKESNDKSRSNDLMPKARV